MAKTSAKASAASAAKSNDLVPVPEADTAPAAPATTPEIAAAAAADEPAPAPAEGEGEGEAEAAEGSGTSKKTRVMKPKGEVGGESVTFAGVLAQLAEISEKTKKATQDVQRLQKDCARAAKENGRRPKRVLDPNAEPSGFRKPVHLSLELADFIGVDADALVSRTTATRAVTDYIKGHALQDQPDKRIIKPDPKLQALLKAGPDKVITYFNLQSFLKDHFLKGQSAHAPALAPAAVVSAVPIAA